MKNTVVITIFILTFCLKINGAVDVLTYDIDVKQEQANGIRVSLRYTFTDTQPDSIISFILNSDTEIESLTLSTSEYVRPYKYELSENDTLFIYLSEKPSSGIDYTLHVKYFTSVNQMYKGELVFKGEQNWYPSIQGDIFQYNMSIQAFVDMYSFGARDSLITSNVIPLIFLPHGSYEKVYCMCDETEIFGFFLSKDGGTIDDITFKVCNSLNYYSLYLQKRDDDYLSLIELSEFSAAQSLPSIILFGSLYIKNYSYPGWSEWVSHEVAHQWIGRSVYINDSPETKGRGFLEESLTEYLNHCFIENEFGRDSMETLLRYDSALYATIFDRDDDKPLIDVYSSNKKEDAILSYRKGPLVYHKLRSNLGDTLFNSIIKSFYIENKGKSVSYNDFVDHLKENNIPEHTIKLLENSVNKVGYPD